MNSFAFSIILAVAVLHYAPASGQTTTYVENYSRSSFNATSSQGNVTFGTYTEPVPDSQKSSGGHQVDKSSAGSNEHYSTNNSSLPDDSLEEENNDDKPAYTEEVQQPASETDPNHPSAEAMNDEPENPQKRRGRARFDEPAYFPDTSSATATAPNSGSTLPVGDSFDPTNSTFTIEPSRTIHCPGPLDPNTGEGYLDADGICAIACYNNLILNETGDSCTCPPTFELDPVEVKCICPSPRVQRGSKCVLLPSQAASAHRSNHKRRSLNEQLTFGMELLHGKYNRTQVDVDNCPEQELACRLPSGGYECLDPEVTLESCGGCASQGTGVDCRDITGADEVGCINGSCIVINCMTGYKLEDGKCIRRIRRKP